MARFPSGSIQRRLGVDVMQCMLCRNRVRDYEVWKRIFDSHASAHRAAGMNLVRLWRVVDESNNIFFLFEISDIERAKLYVSMPDSERREAGSVLDLVPILLLIIICIILI